MIDEALTILEGYGPEYGGGLSNHAPMAAEALVALRRPDAVLPWVEIYKQRLAERPGRVDRVTEENWREALGQVRRLGDWIAYFDRQLAEAPWKDVVERWVVLLSPGLAGAAAHCVIRTSHIVRRLERRTTPPRLHELAEALGYWAARYQELPGKPSTPIAQPPSTAIAKVAPLPERLRRGEGLITPQMMALKKYPAFDDVIDLTDGVRGKPDFLADLTELFAGVYLENTRNRPIAFIHAVTGPAALRILSPYVPQASRADASRYAWQTAAGIYATFSQTLHKRREYEPAESMADLVDRAVTNGNAHAIKFTEVCVREWTVNPKPVYLEAASAVCDGMRPLRT